MGKNKNKIIGTVILFLAIGVYHFFGEKTECIFSENFKNAMNCERQSTRADVNGRPTVPTLGHRFQTTDTTSENGMLHLYTGDRESIGGGEWHRSVDIAVNRNTHIEWKWAASDCEGYQFWIKIGFMNNRSIYYMASDSKPPGLYRGERFVPYSGKRYRDREGRSRFLPSVLLLVGLPGKDWHVIERSVAEDYMKSYGGLPENHRITGVTVGMMDDSIDNLNEMGISHIKFYSAP